MVRLLYFAWLRETIGRGEECIELPPDITTVGGLVDHLESRGVPYAAAFARREVVRCAVNQEIARPDSAIVAGDEVAFFPPVTGG